MEARSKLIIMCCLTTPVGWAHFRGRGASGKQCESKKETIKGGKFGFQNNSFPVFPAFRHTLGDFHSLRRSDNFDNMQQHRFIKEGRDWYIDLPEFIAGGGSKGDLQMVEGADTMLDLIAGNGRDVTLLIDREPFDGADKLILTERCDPYVGGGYYNLPLFEGKEINQNMWLCAVTEFVFGDLPGQIFIKRLS